MITVTRTVSIAPGKTADASLVARQIADYMRSTWGVENEVLWPIGGIPHCVSWSCHYQDRTALDKTIIKMESDERYRALMRKASETFVEGSVRDSVWQHI